MLTRRIFGWSRLLAATICIVALMHRMLWGMGSQTMASDNFFAYLTIQSNSAFAVLALVAGVIALRTGEDPAWLTTARALVLSWTITAGLAFGLIVWQAGMRGIPISVPWSDVMLHFVLPAWSVVAWVLGPGRRPASWRVVPFVLLYPIVWGVFTIWRGGVIGWYPYYFLDPRQVSGLAEMGVSCAIALSIFALVAASLVVLSRVHPTAGQRTAVVGEALSPGPAPAPARRTPVTPVRRPSHPVH